MSDDARQAAIDQLTELLELYVPLMGRPSDVSRAEPVIEKFVDSIIAAARHASR